MSDQEKREVVPVDWLGHDHTKRLVRRFKDELKQANLLLMRTAHTSGDADVRGAAVEVEQLERFIGHLTGQVGEAVAQ